MTKTKRFNDDDDDIAEEVEGCYYGDPQHCQGELWECQACHEQYCDGHYHETEKGRNVECVACEGERKRQAAGQFGKGAQP